ncbi:MAG: succinate dehydrogenase/fumarate reductase transmembrane subunit [Planctomycetota bacterium]
MSNSKPGFLDRHYLLLRRLHSLTGVFPIGVFLFPHLITNSTIIWARWLNSAHHGDAGVETFQHEVNWIHGLPFLVLIEFGVLFVPIAFHALLGIWFALGAGSNVRHYGYEGNWRYTLQRITGYLGVIFIFMHITALRFGWTYGGLMPAFVPEAAASSTALHFQDSILSTLLMAAIYMVCVLSLVYHFANGLWTAALTWGLTVSVGAQRRWGYICTAVGLALAAATVMAVIGFSTLDVEHARTVEQALLAAG